MAALEGGFETRLGKLLLMLGSPNEPEAQAALRKVNAVLKHNGKDWHWIIESFGQTPDWRDLARREREEEQARFWSAAMAETPADAETVEAARYVLANRTKPMHPDNVEAYERAAAGGTVKGYQRKAILESASKLREMEAYRSRRPTASTQKRRA